MKIRGWRKIGDYKYKHMDESGDKVVVTEVEIEMMHHGTVGASYIKFQVLPRYSEIKTDVLFFVSGEKGRYGLPTNETYDTARRKLVKWMKAHPDG